MVNMWKQQRGESVGDYIDFITKEVSKNAYRGVTRYSDGYPPLSKAKWLVSGILPEINDLLGPDIQRNPTSIPFKDLIEDIQDINWLLILHREYCVGERVSRYNPHGFEVDRDGYIIVYTDGACSSNGRLGARGGVGVWFGENHPSNYSGPLDSSYRQTNNSAEINAVLNALDIIHQYGYNRVAIHSDSQFVINSMTKFIYKWLQIGWIGATGKPIVNKEEFRQLLSAMEDTDVKWVHVKAHEREGNSRHSIGNNEADRLARLGVRMNSN